MLRAAKDLLVRPAELCAKGHVDDKVYRRVDGLQEVNDAPDNFVHVALVAIAGILLVDLIQNAVYGARQDADEED